MPTRTFSRDVKLDLVCQLSAGLQRPAHLSREHQRATSTGSPLLVLASLGAPRHGSAGVHWLGRTPPEAPPMPYIGRVQAAARTRRTGKASRWRTK